MKVKFLKADNGDSILISFQDDLNLNRNILIDGGMPKTYYGSGKHGELHYVLKELKETNQVIDLLILTHIDGDHIGGLKKWFESDKGAFDIIKKVWFNSGKSIAEYFESPENEELIETLKIFDSNLTSVPQAKVFEDYIEKFNIWDKEIIKGGKIVNQNGVNIRLLSPNDKLLEKLLKEYKKPKHDYFTSGKRKDWDTSIKEFIIEESTSDFKFKQDSSVANGSSIAFILTYQEKNYLFLGDAHPDIIHNSLTELGFSQKKPIPVEFLKVSHHGSSKNTSKELLSIICTDNYIISTNSKLHNHPDKRTLARIIANNPNATFYFNYKNLASHIFSDKDFEEYQEFKIKDSSIWK